MSRTCSHSAPLNDLDSPVPPCAAIFKQRLPGEEHSAAGVLAGDREAEVVAVERERAVVVRGAQDDPRGEDLHSSAPFAGAGLVVAAAMGAATFLHLRLEQVASALDQGVAGALLE